MHYRRGKTPATDEFESSILIAGGGNLNITTLGDMENKNELLHNVEEAIGQIKRLEEDRQKLALKIKHHEENVEFLKTQSEILDKSIKDLKGNLVEKYSSRKEEGINDNNECIHGEKNTIDEVLKQEGKAAGILCRIKSFQTTDTILSKDVLGIVATLGYAPDDNISRLFSEYLGLGKMLAIVCKTHEGIKFIERYESEGKLDPGSGTFGLGNSTGRPTSGRFLAICLEDLRPYVGKHVPNDPHKRLDLLMPRLPTGGCPHGFLGFAVNMINVDPTYLTCVTSSGHGLRETLFYSLFSRLQVYRTRCEMERALPYIKDGALSLDGGMVKTHGVFSLGNREEVEVRFPTSFPASAMSLTMVEYVERLRLMTWNKERIDEDMKREERVLESVRCMFDKRKEDFSNYLSQSAPLMSKHEVLRKERNGSG